jgi:Chaperone of endosialidase
MSSAGNGGWLMLSAEFVTKRFQSLLDFNDALVAQSSIGEKVIWKLGQIICFYDLEKLFGVALLHKHFDLFEGEQLVRRFFDKRGTIKPEGASISNVPCIWGFDVTATPSIFALEFANADFNPEALAAVDQLEQSRGFVETFSRCLRQHGAHELYGLGSLFGTDIIAPASNESIIELPESKRELKLERISLSELRRTDSAKTLWIFSKHYMEGSVACPRSTPGDKDAESDTLIGTHCYHCHHCHHCRPQIHSDIRLKRDIDLLGRLDNGLGLHRYRYLWSDQLYVGVMAQEVATIVSAAVLTGADGYLRVDYGRLGLRLQTWNQWLAAH